MSKGPCEVLLIQTSIEADALGELLDPTIRPDPENTRPGWSRQDMPRFVSPTANRANFANSFMLNGLDQSVNERRAAVLTN
jgi:hypothetical protein